MKKNKFEPKITTIGGGTGLSVLLRGLKKYTPDLTAIVSVTDDGGSSGKLRKELGVLPPGDIRNCLVALSEEENLMAKLFQYRFSSAGSLSGHSFGNLFLTAMSALTGSFDEGIAQTSKVLAIRGKVLPATLSSVILKAKLSDGKVVKGESKITKSYSRVKHLKMFPASPPAAPEVINAVNSCDGIVIGPGSLYTSLITNLLVEGMVPALKTAKKPKIYVCNIMTQPNETKNYKLSDHLAAFKKHIGENIFSYIIINVGSIPKMVAKRYERKRQFPVRIDIKDYPGTKIIREDLVSHQEYVRHDPDKLSKIIMKILKDNKK
ncbi:MAG: YvcK family protein [Endomicrobiales bacterium]|nr:YvcK family protein [Endomicrobiales bacterium]